MYKRIYVSKILNIVTLLSVNHLISKIVFYKLFKFEAKNLLF